MCVIHACQWPKEYAQACKILNIAWCSEAICSLLPSKEEYIIDTDVGNIDADDDKKIVAFYCKRLSKHEGNVPCKKQRVAYCCQGFRALSQVGTTWVDSKGTLCYENITFLYTSSKTQKSEEDNWQNTGIFARI